MFGQTLYLSVAPLLYLRLSGPNFQIFSHYRVPPLLERERRRSAESFSYLFMFWGKKELKILFLKAKRKWTSSEQILRFLASFNWSLYQKTARRLLHCSSPAFCVKRTLNSRFLRSRWVNFGKHFWCFCFEALWVLVIILLSAESE